VKNLALNVSFRVFLIIGLSVLFAFVLVRGQMLFGPLVIGILLSVSTVELIRYINKSNKDLTRMLLSLRQGAFTDTFSQKGKQTPDVSNALNEIIQEFAKVNMQKELHYQYLHALNENINVAILSFDENGALLMMNPEARRLLNVPMLSKVSDVEAIDPNLYRAILNIRPLEKRMVKAFIEEQVLQLAVQVKEILVEKKTVRIVLLQNISAELESKEIEAWQALTQELTHEIMNSVTPIASLTDAIHSLIRNNDGTPKDLAKLDEESVADIQTSVSTIGHRSKGLLRFITSYKEFAKNPELRLESVNVATLVKRVIDLLGPDLERASIHTSVNFSNSELPMTGDPGLIEQVLINIIKNAMDALPRDGSGVIGINARKPTADAVSITVSDNGPGMNQDTVSRIFVPFFTTKANGTGIGLSLSKKIMRLHNGTIRVQSTLGEGSVFMIEWRNH
jgi:two-component system, NtrC family, nitrogen regulation sensor histidine kinase NtrY